MPESDAGHGGVSRGARPLRDLKIGIGQKLRRLAGARGDDALGFGSRGKDGALLRYSLGNEYTKAGDPVNAALHLRHAVTLDPEYTAAWKLYGRALAAAGQDAEALVAYREGIAVAHARGDKQAEKEMTVFARRIERGGDPQ